MKHRMRIDPEELKDAERFNWLLKKGIAWNGCYHGDWKEGEWLYGHLGAREYIDFSMALERTTK